eukprot:s4794_g5.t1
MEFSKTVLAEGLFAKFPPIYPPNTMPELFFVLQLRLAAHSMKESQVRTLLALEVRLDVGSLDEAVDAVHCGHLSREKAKHPVPHANPRVEQPLVTELSFVVLQQEVVVLPLFEGRACCEIDAGCVFYDGGAGGGKTPQILP